MMNVSWTMVSVIAIAMYVVISIIREVLIIVIRKRKQVIVLDRADLVHTIADYIAITYFSVLCIANIYDPTPSPGWLAIMWLIGALFYGYATIMLLYHQIEDL